LQKKKHCNSMTNCNPFYAATIKLAARPKRVSELEAVMFTIHYHGNVQAGNMLVIDWLLVENIHIFKVAEFFSEFFWFSWLN
jgi:hypothetical protein